MATAVETAALDRMLDALGRCLTPESAQQVVELRAERSLQERLDVLAEKSTAGALTADERAEYETYLRALDFISVLQSKARHALGRSKS